MHCLQLIYFQRIFFYGVTNKITEMFKCKKLIIYVITNTNSIYLK